LGKNASYAHLADYLPVPPRFCLFLRQPNGAVARRLGSADDELEALQKLIKLSPPGDVRRYFARYQELNDSLQTARNAAKNQFALIRYDVEKNKTDNLRLQKDNADKRYQLIKQRILLYSILFTFGILTFFSVRWYRKRKERQEQETQNAVRENQRKTSKKVHDTLANDVYRIMKKIQHDLTLDRDWLLYNIDDVYQRARDISYEITTDSMSISMRKYQNC